MAVEDSDTRQFLDTVEGEITFFRSLMRARPVGLHRHFHALSMRSAIHQDTGRYVSIDDIWDKLKTCYDLDAVETLEMEGYESPGSSSSTPRVIASPSPSDNLATHPFFRKEYELPFEESYEALVSARRVRESASPVSSPSPPPLAKAAGTRSRKRGRRNANTAGLVGGESDSSALTQESGDESVVPTPRESVATGTDAGTEYADDEEVEVAASPALSVFAKPTRGRGGKAKRGGGRGRGAAAGPSRAAKKRKR
ncbi:hypothetical protein BV25DRAFT_1826549 [Artomyces pyxidatus]|uniref:Uncharacterized protein n=1 Tax=Artomyces pyxidatus TaxID=48021 RepID=A0ACB8SZ14_9AGAM|nr:hypothetical protein BV25DRAFT_1826549 [Artomyces pyxidatus]